VNWIWVAVVVLVIAAAVFAFRRLRVLALIAAVLAVALLLTGAWSMMFPSKDSNEAGKKPAATPSATASPSVTPSGEPTIEPAVDTKCPTWEMSTDTPKNGNWITNGVQEIRTANTQKEARHAADVWMDKVERNTATLSGAISYFTNKTVSQSELVKDGCATKRAESLAQEVTIALAMSSVKPEMVPVTARNSGTRNGSVYAYSVPGVGGDRHAIKVTLQNGKVVWIMARCGNIASHGKPPVHTGKPPKGTPMPPPHHQTPHHHVCQPPQYVPASMWNYSTCSKKDTSFNYEQNESPAHQTVQENHNHVYTGPTQGTSGAPSNTQVHQHDSNPTHSGSNSGSQTGSGTTQGGGTDGSTGTTPDNPPVDSGQGGTGNGDGGGVIIDPQ
jgi:hypothetical protein